MPKIKTNDFYDDARKSDDSILHPSRTFAALKVFYDHGHIIALIDAFSLAKKLPPADASIKFSEDGYHFPKWVEDGIKKELMNLHIKGKTIGMGRTGNLKVDFIENQKHLERYLAMAKAKNTIGKNGKPLTGEKAFKEAKKLLFGTIGGWVGRRQTEDSYRLVRDEISDEDMMLKYYPLPKSLTKKFY